MRERMPWNFLMLPSSRLLGTYRDSTADYIIVFKGSEIIKCKSQRFSHYFKWRIKTCFASCDSKKKPVKLSLNKRMEVHYYKIK